MCQKEGEAPRWRSTVTDSFSGTLLPRSPSSALFIFKWSCCAALFRNTLRIHNPYLHPTNLDAILSVHISGSPAHFTVALTYGAVQGAGSGYSCLLSVLVLVLRHYGLFDFWSPYIAPPLPLDKLLLGSPGVHECSALAAK